MTEEEVSTIKLQSRMLLSHHMKTLVLNLHTLEEERYGQLCVEEAMELVTQWRKDWDSLDNKRGENENDRIT